MFINPTVFKKLIKDSWSKEGLTVGTTEEEIFFAGAFWVIRTYKEEMPKKIKAAVIELIGDFPDKGEVFTCHKKRETQYEIAENEYWNITENFAKAQIPLNVTKIQYAGAWEDIRLLQEGITNKCIAIKNLCWNLIDTSAVEEFEGKPKGPVTEFMDAGLIFWQSETMTLAVCRINMNETEELDAFMDHMEQHLLPVFK